MRRRAWSVWYCLLSVSTLSMAAEREALTLYYIERPPFTATMPDGTITGLTANVAAQALRKAGFPYQWQLLPFRRQLLMLETNHERACAVGLFKTPDRARIARYSLPLYRDRYQVAIARRDDARIPDRISAKVLLANHAIKLLLKDGFSYGPIFDGLIASSKPQTVHTFDEVIDLLQLIQLGGADYTFLPVEEATLLLTSGKYRNLRQIALTDAPAGEQRHLMCSKRIPQRDIDAMNQAIRAVTSAENAP